MYNQAASERLQAVSLSELLSDQRGLHRIYVSAARVRVSTCCGAKVCTKLLQLVDHVCA